MTIAYDRWGVQAHLGNCVDVMRGMEPESISAILTDPPYGLAELPTDKVVKALTEWVSGNREYIPTGGRGFMSLRWDCFVPPPAAWDECYRVMKPGAYMLVFAGTRTADLMGISIRLAGFTIRETVQWIYASGMPKGLNIGKAIDRAAGVEAEIIDTIPDRWAGKGSVLARSLQNTNDTVNITTPTTDAAKQWAGWNTALKPSQEPVIVGQKPFKGTIADNVLKHGTGGLNIGACRVGSEERLNGAAGNKPGGASYNMSALGMPQGVAARETIGRWPANVVFSHSESCTEDSCVDGECPVAELDGQSAGTRSDKPSASGAAPTAGASMWKLGGVRTEGTIYVDSGGASRFFPCFRFEAKAPESERPRIAGESHSTVKPVSLLRFLSKLITPPGGTILDCFAGTGSTGQAARAEGFRCILIDDDPQAIEWIRARLDARPKTEAPAAGEVIVEPDGDLLDLLDLLDDDEAAAS